ncbi:MAG: 30S ribosomal protein S6 [Actinomycetaceae bacterium]|nr:30S ribosomal protein S6 [Actinomycetaceae bacterium]
MRKYELMIILSPEVDERTVEPSLEKFLQLIKDDGGSVDNVDVWGKRRFAYPINKFSEGIYVVVNMTTTPEVSAELDRQLSLNETIMRTKLLRV